jgi:hypothetical protein
LDDPRVAEVESIAAIALDAILTRPPDPIALVFLLRQFAATDRDAIRDRLGEALTDALAQHTVDAAPAQRAAWLLLFREAAALSSDERLAAAAVGLTDSLRRDWRSRASVADAVYAVDACLRAADVGGDRAGPLIAAAIDELERIVGESYEPGEGIGDYADHIRAAAALITAYDVTGRLPYAMLAEELMQASARVSAGRGFTIECEAARVYCRLAALHDDDDYRAAAVIAPDANYRADASRMLAGLSPRAPAEGAPIYGLALSELLALNRVESPDNYDY